VSFSAEKAAQSRVVMLCGSEPLLVRRALGELLEAVHPDEFDLESMEGAGDPTQWLASAGTAPFMGERRVVVVRNLLRCDAEPDLGGLPDSALLVLVADEETGDDARQSRLKTIRGRWEKVCKAAGGLVAAFDSDPQSLQAAIKAEMSRLGLIITPKAAELFAEMTGGSLSRVLEESEKLALFVGAGAQVREADVKAVVVASREWSVFRLVDATLLGRVGEALRHLRYLVGSSTSAEDAALRNILPNMTRNLRLLWQARLCVEAGTWPNKAPAEVLAMFPEKPNLAKEPEYRQRSMMTLARKATLPTIAHQFSLLSDADARLKGLLPGYSGMETLEELVLEMSASLND